MGVGVQRADPDWNDKYLLYKSLASALAWIALNLSLSLTNKWLFKMEVIILKLKFETAKKLNFLILLASFYSIFRNLNIPFLLYCLERI